MHTYICQYRGVCLSLQRFLTGVLHGFFVWKVLSGVFVHPLLSEYIHYNRKLNITFNVRFHMYEFFLKCDVTCSWTPPVSQTVTPSRTPSALERDILYERPLIAVYYEIDVFDFFTFYCSNQTSIT